MTEENKNTTSRRKFLKIGGAAAAGALLGGVAIREIFCRTGDNVPFILPPPGQAMPWKNWSGALECQPAMRLSPQSAEELAAAFKNTCGAIRAVGSGHSFSGLVPTDGTLVSLSRLNGIIDYNPQTLEATIGAGTRLQAIGDPLRAVGQALQNMPDIDQQTLAGAISTGTHGTGLNLTSLSGFVTGLELVTAKGDVLWCDKDSNPEIFKAAQVSLGALGVVTKIRMKNQTPYMLERRANLMDLDEYLDSVDTLVRENRNVDSFFFPHSDKIAVITYNEAPSNVIANRLPEATDPLPILKQLEKYLGWANPVRRAVMNAAMGFIPPEYEADQSYKIYPSVRSHRFHNMEYQIPWEAGPAAMREIRDAIYNQNLEVYFPIQFRCVAADDMWLSPFHGRLSCSISVTLDNAKDPQAYFGVIEQILRKYDGRPHWGKMHNMSAAELAPLYPHWKDFLAVREALDPEGRFLNKHLSQVLGVAPKHNAPSVQCSINNAPKP